MGESFVVQFSSASQCLYLFHLSRRITGQFELSESSITVEEKLIVAKIFLKVDEIFFF